MAAPYVLVPFVFFFGTSYILIRIHSRYAGRPDIRPVPLRYLIAPVGAAVLTLLFGLFSLAISTEYRVRSIGQPTAQADMPSVDWAINH
ncbi:MAG TPA: hypothetical protein VHZ55_13100 [Bryobacteraceae bacterium]|jgi:hypothetical protein|nr:hypothetical protein [Bryobacteraceae bacterium]